MGGPRDPGEHIDSPQPDHIDGDAVATEETVDEEVETESDDGEEVEGT